jgi:hypothetical protein
MFVDYYYLASSTIVRVRELLHFQIEFVDLK